MTVRSHRGAKPKAKHVRSPKPKKPPKVKHQKVMHEGFVRGHAKVVNG